MHKSSLISIIVLALILIAGISHAATNVIVTVTNNQGSPTSANFQQMIYFNPQNSLFNGDLASDLGNIRFYQGSNELHSWCESGCSSSSSNAIFWVKLPGGISANSNAIINITFLSTNAEYDDVYAGEAPQLSSTYAEYDNGNMIFSYYQRFGGLSTLPSGWSNSGATITYNANDIVVSTTSGCAGIYRTAPETHPYSMDFYGDITQLASGGGGTYIGTEYSSGVCAGTAYVLTYTGSGSMAIGNYGNEYASTAINSGTNIDTLNILSGTSGSLSQNYGTSTSTSSLGSASDVSLVFQTNTGGSGTTKIPIYWIRYRLLPPNGVMPSVSISQTRVFSLGNPTPTSQMIYQIQTANIVSSGAINGALPYLYQWLAEAPGQSQFTASEANSLCNDAQNTSCLFATSSNTVLGTYQFEIMASDSASHVLTSLIANVIVEVQPTVQIYNLSPQYQVVQEGQQGVISSEGAYKGIAPYSYQWLAAAPGSNTLTASEGSALCSTPLTPICSFTTTSSTPFGSYEFELKAVDAGTNSLTNSVTSSYAELNVTLPQKQETSGSWTPEGNYPIWVQSQPCAISKNNFIYCFGGKTTVGASNSVYSAPIINNAIGTWTADTNLPSDISSYNPCVISDNNYAYCIISGYAFSAKIVNNSISVWHANDSLPEAIFYSCVIEQSNLYCFGRGQAYLGLYQNYAYYASIVNNSIGTWKPFPTIPYFDNLAYVDQDYSCLSSPNSQIYCMSNDTGEVYTISSTNYSGSWREISEMGIEGNAYLDTCALDPNNYIYCLNGGGNTPISSITNYSISILANGTQYPVNQIAEQACAISEFSYIYCIGGGSNSVYASQIRVINQSSSLSVSISPDTSQVPLTIEKGNTAPIVITLQNTGDSSVTWGIDDYPSSLSLSQSSGIIGPNQIMEIGGTINTKGLPSNDVGITNTIHLQVLSDGLLSGSEIENINIEVTNLTCNISFFQTDCFKGSIPQVLPGIGDSGPSFLAVDMNASLSENGISGRYNFTWSIRPYQSVGDGFVLLFNQSQASSVANQLVTDLSTDGFTKSTYTGNALLVLAPDKGFNALKNLLFYEITQDAVEGVVTGAVSGATVSGFVESLAIDTAGSGIPFVGTTYDVISFIDEPTSVLDGIQVVMDGISAGSNFARLSSQDSCFVDVATLNFVGCYDDYVNDSISNKYLSDSEFVNTNTVYEYQEVSLPFFETSSQTYNAMFVIYPDQEMSFQAYDLNLPETPANSVCGTGLSTTRNCSYVNISVVENSATLLTNSIDVSHNLNGTVDLFTCGNLLEHNYGGKLVCGINPSAAAATVQLDVINPTANILGPNKYYGGETVPASPVQDPTIPSILVSYSGLIVNGIFNSTNSEFIMNASSPSGANAITGIITIGVPQQLEPRINYSNTYMSASGNTIPINITTDNSLSEFLIYATINSIPAGSLILQLPTLQPTVAVIPEGDVLSLGGGSFQANSPVTLQYFNGTNWQTFVNGTVNTSSTGEFFDEVSTPPSLNSSYIVIRAEGEGNDIALTTGLAYPDVLVVHSDGSTSEYGAKSNMNASRGQSLINALSNLTTGDIVYLTSGTYDMLGYTINLSKGNSLSNVSIIGAGEYKTVLTNYTNFEIGTNSLTANLSLINIGSRSFTGVPISGWWGTPQGDSSTMYGGSVLENVYSNTSVPGIRLYGIMNSNITISNVTVTGGPQNNMLIDPASGNGTAYITNSSIYSDYACNGSCDYGLSISSNATISNTNVTAIFSSGVYACSGIRTSGNTTYIYGGSEYATCGSDEADLSNAGNGTVSVCSNTYNTSYGAITSICGPDFHGPTTTTTSTTTTTTTTVSTTTSTIIPRYAYVTNYGSDNVSVIDPANNTVIGSIVVGSDPVGVAAYGRGYFDYISDSGNDSVTVINPSSGTVVDTISVGIEPQGVAFDPTGNLAYVVDLGSNNISIVRLFSDTVLGNITVGSGPEYVAFSPSGASAYVTNENSSTVSVINVSTETVVNTIEVGSIPIGIASDPLGHFAYVADFGSNTVSIINTSTSTVVNTISVGPEPYGLAVNPSGTLAYVTDYSNDTVSAINLATNTVTGTIEVGTDPSGVTFSPNGTLAYVANYGSNTVSVINTISSTVVNTIAVGANPTMVAFVPLQPLPPSPGALIPAGQGTNSSTTTTATTTSSTSSSTTSYTTTSTSTSTSSSTVSSGGNSGSTGGLVGGSSSGGKPNVTSSNTVTTTVAKTTVLAKANSTISSTTISTTKKSASTTVVPTPPPASSGGFLSGFIRWLTNFFEGRLGL